MPATRCQVRPARPPRRRVWLTSAAPQRCLPVFSARRPWRPRTPALTQRTVSRRGPHQAVLRQFLTPAATCVLPAPLCLGPPAVPCLYAQADFLGTLADLGAACLYVRALAPIRIIVTALITGLHRAAVQQCPGDPTASVARCARLAAITAAMARLLTQAAARLGHALSTGLRLFARPTSTLPSAQQGRTTVHPAYARRRRRSATPCAVRRLAPTRLPRRPPARPHTASSVAPAPGPSAPLLPTCAAQAR